MSAKSKAEQYYVKLKIDDDKIKRKSEELIRLLDLKAPAGLQGKANTCKYVVCIHLACKLNDHPFDRAASFKACGCEPFIYREAYALVTNILHIIIPLQFELICKEFECPHLAKFVKKIFNRYKEIFINALPENRREDVHFDNPSYAAASFLLTAEYKKVKVDKKKLLEITDCRSKDLEQSYESINELIFIPLKTAEAKAAELKAEQNKSSSKQVEEKKPGKTGPKTAPIKIVNLNEVDSHQNHKEDFIRSKVNDILKVNQTEEDIQNIQLELMVDVDGLNMEIDGMRKQSKREQDLEQDDWLKEVLKERKEQKEKLAKQQATAPLKTQRTLDSFMKKNEPKTVINELRAEEEQLVEDDLKNIPIKLKPGNERDKKQEPSQPTPKRKSTDPEKKVKSKKKSKESKLIGL